MNVNKHQWILLPGRIRVCSRSFAVLIFCSSFAAAAPYVINSAGQQIDGTAIESAADGTILLTASNGQVLTFRSGSYKQAFADKPEEMVQVETLAKSGDLAGAAAILRRVKKQYAFLGWDQRAGLMLARVELAQKNFAAAITEYEALFAVQPQLKTVPAERANYMQALLGAGRIKETAALIDEDIASGSREAAARAQIVRGDMKAAAGQYEEALLDYLRTALLFTDQTAVLPEATYKTAVALKKRNDPRAADYFQKVIKEFPNSEFAESAKKGVE
ncbi:MAG: tetratricopeptide repeat protein [Pontiellaceae bacterium]|nr:tetratricopeptide repeat protein [Pontiellaceae bacterium]